MKNFKIVLLLVLSFVSYHSNAQETTAPHKSLPVNPKTNCQMRYLYFPNLAAYFDKLKNVYYYQLNGKWETAEELPEHYGGYSLYNNARVAIDNYDDDNPEQFLKIHKKMYPYNSNGRMKRLTASTD